MHQIYEEGLKKSPANYEPLSPLSFLLRSFNFILTRRQPFTRTNECRGGNFIMSAKNVSALAEEGVGFGDTVAAVLPNVPAMMVLHFAVPMVGAVLMR